MSGLTPEEIKFFETGDASHLTPGTPEPNAPTDPIALAGLGTDPAPAPAPAADPAPAPATPAPTATNNDEVARLLRESLANSQSQLAQLQAKLEEMSKPPAPKEPEAPDPQTDPLGHLMHQVNATNKAVQELQTKITQQESQQDNLKQLQDFAKHVQDLKAEYVKTTPDFDAAYNHLRAARLEDLKSVGFSEDNARKQLLSEEFQVAQTAIQQQKNPAEVFYAMAKRHGYVAKTTPAPSAEHLQKIEQAAAASQATNLPRAAEPADLTIAGLRQASEADLNKLVMDPKAWAKIAGKDTEDIFPVR